MILRLVLVVVANLITTASSSDNYNRRVTKNWNLSNVAKRESNLFPTWSTTLDSQSRQSQDNLRLLSEIAVQEIEKEGGNKQQQSDEPFSTISTVKSRRKGKAKLMSEWNKIYSTIERDNKQASRGKSIASDERNSTDALYGSDEDYLPSPTSLSSFDPHAGMQQFPLRGESSLSNDHSHTSTSEVLEKLFGSDPSDEEVPGREMTKPKKPRGNSKRGSRRSMKLDMDETFDKEWMKQGLGTHIPAALLAKTILNTKMPGLNAHAIAIRALKIHCFE